MFFILSTGRSGTTTIARAISLIHGCICLHEPSPELIIESSAYRNGDMDDEKIRKILLETRQPILKNSVYCESNQTLSLIISICAEAFPKARYIWLMRNGLDVVASIYQKQWYTGHSENHEKYEDCSAIEKAWIDGRIQGDRCGDMNSTDWAELDRFAKCCWYWNYVNKLIEADLNKYEIQKYFFLRLEELDKQFEGLIKWMGLKVAIVPATGKHNIAKREPYHWSNWSIKERKIFEHFCGELMDKYYPAWRTPSGTWNGVDYHSNKNITNIIRANSKLVKKINALFARNTPN